MRGFHVLRLAAGLTIAETGKLLGVDSARVEAYESGQAVPRARELQVLRGLANIARKNTESAGCESGFNSTTINNQSQNDKSALNRVKNIILEQRAVGMNDRLAISGPPQVDRREDVPVSRNGRNRLMTVHRSVKEAHSTNARYQVLCGDALELLKTLPSASVDICMTSPPYWGHREYDVHGIGQEPTQDKYIRALCAVLQEVKRVLRAKGSLWLNIGDTYDAKSLVGIPWRVALCLIDRDGWILRNDVIWNKIKGGPDNSRDKLRNIHEHVFHFVKQKKLFL